MAKRKLTLSIKEELIKKLKHKAIEENKSASKIIEELIKKWIG